MGPNILDKVTPTESNPRSVGRKICVTFQKGQRKVKAKGFEHYYIVITNYWSYDRRSLSKWFNECQQSTHVHLIGTQAPPVSITKSLPATQGDNNLLSGHLCHRNIFNMY